MIAVSELKAADDISTVHPGHDFVELPEPWLCACRYTLMLNTSKGDRAAIRALILQHVPDSKLLRSSGTELVSPNAQVVFTMAVDTGGTFITAPAFQYFRGLLQEWDTERWHTLASFDGFARFRRS